jgi:hypothetical protein
MIGRKSTSVEDCIDHYLALRVLLGHSSLVMVQRYVAAGEQERALVEHHRHPVA